MDTQYIHAEDMKGFTFSFKPSQEAVTKFKHVNKCHLMEPKWGKAEKPSLLGLVIFIIH